MKRLLFLVAVLTLVTAGSAFADPPDHPRFSLSQDKAGLAHEPEIISGIVPPDVRDHRLVQELLQADRLTPQSGFDWGDAGIGAGTTLAAVLTALGGTLLIRGAHRGGQLRPSKHTLTR